jgi:hypothetical protein
MLDHAEGACVSDLNHIASHLGLEPPVLEQSTDPITIWRKKRAAKRRKRIERKKKERAMRSKGWK